MGEAKRRRLAAVAKKHTSVVEFHEGIAAEADRRLEVMLNLSDDELTQYARDVIEAHTIVIGTFPDPSQPAGVGLLVIKGHAYNQLLREAGRAAGHLDFSVTAIPCGARQWAVAAWEMWGDGKTQEEA